MGSVRLMVPRVPLGLARLGVSKTMLNAVGNYTIMVARCLGTGLAWRLKVAGQTVWGRVSRRW